MTALVLAARRDARPDWLADLESELDLVRGMTTAARVSTIGAVLAAVREQIARGQKVVVISTLQLDDGSSVDVVDACRDLNVPVLTLVDAGETPPVESLLNLARTPVVFQPGATQNVVDALQNLTEPHSAPTNSASPTPRANGQLVVVASGGSDGKSTVAAPLAVHMARALGMDNAALLELTCELGSAELLLGLQEPADHHLEGLLAAVDELRSEDVVRAAPVTPAGCRLIAGPSDMEHAALLEPVQAKELLRKARRTFEVTVVDTSRFVDDILVGAFQAADLVLWVTTLRMTSVRHLVQLSRTAARLGVSRARMGVVVNGVPDRPTLVQRQLQRELAGEFPNTMLVNVPLDPTPWTEWMERGDPGPRVDSGAAGPALARLAAEVAQVINVAQGSTPNAVLSKAPAMFGWPAFGRLRNPRGSSAVSA